MLLLILDDDQTIYIRPLPLKFTVICRIFIRSSVKIFCSVQFRLLFSPLEQSHSFIWGYAAEHGMALIWKYRIKGYLFTLCIPSLDLTKLVQFSVEILTMCYSITAYEHAQLYRACNILILSCSVAFKDSFSSI